MVPLILGLQPCIKFCFPGPKKFLSPFLSTLTLFGKLFFATQKVSCYIGKKAAQWLSGKILDTEPGQNMSDGSIILCKKPFFQAFGYFSSILAIDRSFEVKKITVG